MFTIRLQITQNAAPKFIRLESKEALNLALPELVRGQEKLKTYERWYGVEMCNVSGFRLLAGESLHIAVALSGGLPKFNAPFYLQLEQIAGVYKRTKSAPIKSFAKFEIQRLNWASALWDFYANIVCAHFASRNRKGKPPQVGLAQLARKVGALKVKRILDASTVAAKLQALSEAARQAKMLGIPIKKTYHLRKQRKFDTHYTKYRVLIFDTAFGIIKFHAYIGQPELSEETLNLFEDCEPFRESKIPGNDQTIRNILD